MEFDAWTFAFQLINVTILLALLGRFMFRPIAAMIERRQAQIRQTLDAAEARQREAAEAKARAEAERDSIAAQRLDLIRAARSEAETQRDRILDTARAEARALAEALATEAAHRAEAETRDREKRAVALSVTIAKRLLDTLPAGVRVAGFAERLTEALRELDPAARQAFVADRAALRLVAPRPLNPAERAEALAALRSILPEADPTVEVQPDLIAGLELKGRHSVVHNSLRHDLSRISDALVRHADL